MSRVDHLQRLFRAGILDVQALRDAVREALAAPPCEDAEESADDPEIQAQQRLQRAIFEDPIVRSYPPPRAAQQRMLKSILSVLDQGCVAEVDDELYAACVQGLAGGVGGDAECEGFDGYRTLEIPDAGYIVLRVAAQMGGAMETGSTLWTAGCALLGLSATGALDGHLTGHVLELGAGTGALGLGLARRGGPVVRVTLTDGQPAVVENLRHNAEVTASLSALPAAVEVQHLEWGSPNLGMLPAEAVDVIIGSDLVYDTASLPALAGLLRQLLQPCGTAAMAVLAITRRSENTFAKLFEAMEAASLVWEDMPVPPSAWSAAARWLPLAHDWSSGSPAAEGSAGARLGAVCLWCVRSAASRSDGEASPTRR